MAAPCLPEANALPLEEAAEPEELGVAAALPALLLPAETVDPPPSLILPPPVGEIIESQTLGASASSASGDSTLFSPEAHSWILVPDSPVQRGAGSPCGGTEASQPTEAADASQPPTPPDIRDCESIMNEDGAGAALIVSQILSAPSQQPSPHPAGSPLGACRPLATSGEPPLLERARGASLDALPRTISSEFPPATAGEAAKAWPPPPAAPAVFSWLSSLGLDESDDESDDDDDGDGGGCGGGGGGKGRGGGGGISVGVVSDTADAKCGEGAKAHACDLMERFPLASSLGVGSAGAWGRPLTLAAVLIASHAVALLVGVALGRHLEQQWKASSQTCGDAFLTRRFSSGAGGQHARLCNA